MLIPDIQLRAQDIGASGWIIGAILASTFVVQVLVSPLWGAHSDRIGRKTVFVSCTLLSALSMAIYVIANTIPLLFVSRIVAGFGAANIAVAQASITEDNGANGKSRTAALGRLTAAMSLGMIAGPAFGGVVSHAYGSAAVGWIGCAASTFGAIVVALYGKFYEGRKVETRGPIGFRPLFKEFPQLAPLVIVASVAWFALSSLEGTFGRLLDHVWGYGRLEFGLIFSFEAVVGLIAQGVLIGWLSRKLGDRRLLVGSYVLQGVGLALTPFAPELLVIFGASFLFALGNSLANPTVGGLCSDAVSASKHGEMFGVLQSARGVGFAIGPLVGGILFDIAPSLPYIFAGMVCLAAAAIVTRTVPNSTLVSSEPGYP